MSITAHVNTYDRKPGNLYLVSLFSVVDCSSVIVDVMVDCFSFIVEVLVFLNNFLPVAFLLVDFLTWWFTRGIHEGHMEHDRAKFPVK